MMEIFKKNKMFCLLILVLPLFIGIGIIFVDYIPLLNKIPGDNGDWIGFWASYLGTIVAILIAIWVAKHEAEVNKEEIEELIQKQNETSENLRSVSETQKAIGTEIKKLSENNIELFAAERILEAEFNLKKIILDLINRLHISIDEYIENTKLYNGAFERIDEKLTSKDSELSYGEIRKLEKYSNNMFKNSYQLESIISTINSLNEETSIISNKENFDKMLKEFDKYENSFSRVADCENRFIRNIVSISSMRAKDEAKINLQSFDDLKMAISNIPAENQFNKTLLNSASLLNEVKKESIIILSKLFKGIGG